MRQHPTSIRLTRQEKEEYAALALAQGISLSDYTRQALLMKKWADKADRREVEVGEIDRLVQKSAVNNPRKER